MCTACTRVSYNTTKMYDVCVLVPPRTLYFLYLIISVKSRQVGGTLEYDYTTIEPTQPNPMNDPVEW